MRSARYSAGAAGRGGSLPPMAEHFLEIEEPELSDADLKLIDSFADLEQPRRKAVLEKTRQLLGCEAQASSQRR